MTVRRYSNEKMFILNGLLAAIVVNLTQPFAVKYLERLGGTPFHISLFNSLPGFVGMAASLAGAMFMVRCSDKSHLRLTAEFTAASRLMLLLPLLLSLASPELAPILFVTIIGLRSFPEAISQTGIQNATGELFRDEDRSTAITKKNMYSVPAAFVVTILSGIILKWLPQNDHQRMMLYQAFFAVAALIGLLECMTLLRMKPLQTPAACSTEPFMKLIGTAMKNKAFVGYTLSAIIFYFGWQMGWPLFSIYMLVDLKADEWWLSLVSVASSSAMFFGYGWWNRQIKKHGNARVAGFATLGLGATPIFMILSKSMLHITLLHLIIGFFVAGTTTVLLNFLLEVAPQENRLVYIGLFNMLVNLSLAISPIVGLGAYNQFGIVKAMLIVACVRVFGAAIFFMSHRKSAMKVD